MPNFSETAFREVQHRCANDLQMVAALCSLSASRQRDPQTRDAILEIANRVNVLVGSRREVAGGKKQTLEAMLRRVADGLHAMAEPHGVAVDLQVAGPMPQMTDDAATAASIAVNELGTNALKHAFTRGHTGTVKIFIDNRETNDFCSITVEDDGLPFATPPQDSRERQPGIGLDLARRSLAAQGGMLIFPNGNSKRFEIRLPVQAVLGAA